MEEVVDTYNIHKAKTHLSRLIEKSARGAPFVIAKAGKPMVKVVPIEDVAPEPVRRIGFFKDVHIVHDNFKEIGREEIEKMFCGEAD